MVVATSLLHSSFDYSKCLRSIESRRNLRVHGGTCWTMTLLPAFSRSRSQFHNLEVRHRSRCSGVRARNCATIPN